MSFARAVSVESRFPSHGKKLLELRYLDLYAEVVKRQNRNCARSKLAPSLDEMKITREHQPLVPGLGIAICTDPMKQGILARNHSTEDLFSN